MWRMCKGAIVSGAALLGLMGCHKAEYLQPPKPKDEFTRPPVDDARFVNPPSYPNNLLNQDSLHGKDDDAGPGHGPGSRPGGPRGN